MHIGVTGIVADMLAFQTRPCRRGDNLARLRLYVAETDFLFFLGQRQMRVIAAGVF